MEPTTPGHLDFHWQKQNGARRRDSSVDVFEFYSCHERGQDGLYVTKRAKRGHVRGFSSRHLREDLDLGLDRLTVGLFFLDPWSLEREISACKYTHGE